MNPNAEKWLAALESGEFLQGQGRLRTDRYTGDSRFCCLGVACEVYRRETGNGEWAIGLGRQRYSVSMFLGASLALPEAVQNWLGLKTHNGGFFDPSSDVLPIDCYGDNRHLAGRNDTGIDFPGIIEIVRTHPEMFVDNDTEEQS